MALQPTRIKRGRCAVVPVSELSGEIELTATQATPPRQTRTETPVGGWEATRHLCAAMHLDRGLCNEFLEELEQNRFRAIGASPGVDLHLVARHALAAQSRRRTRDHTLTLIVVAGLFGAAIAAASAGGLAVTVCLLAFCAAWGVVAAERLVARRLVGHELLAGSFRPPATYPPVSAEWTARLADLWRAQEGNITVYRGFAPFVGSGKIVGHWSFAINLERGQDGKAPQPVSVRDLDEHVVARINGLGLPTLRPERRLLVDGRGIRHDRRFLGPPASRPHTHADEALLDAIRDHHERAVRHYRCIRVVEWEGEVVISVFLSLTKLANTLVAEAYYLLLPPLSIGRRAVDDFAPRPRTDEIVELLVEAAFVAPAAMVMAPLRFWGELREGFPKLWARDDEERTHVERTPSWDYGASATLRERQAGGYTRYLQAVDKDLYVKVVEREILDALTDFLDSKGVDISELRERQNTIMNFGVMANTVNAGNVVAGKQVSIGEANA
jgi:hypothetical protein